MILSSISILDFVFYFQVSYESFWIVRIDKSGIYFETIWSFG